MNVLSREKRLAVLAALVDGNSERAIDRMTGVNRITVSRVAMRCGRGAINLHDRVVRNLSCSMIQADEIWSYVGKKQKRVTEADGPGVGEAYTFVALCGTSKIVVSFHVGKRDQATTDAFMSDLRSRLITMPMMASDGFAPYPSAVGAEFGEAIDYGTMKKNYSNKGRRDDDHRYEPPRDPFITKKTVFGAPDHDKITTYAVERNNGTMRHFIGRMRRLVYAFSKDLEHHKAAVSLAYAYYNFCWVVKTLKRTPAMAAGLTDHVWTIDEFLDVIWNEPVSDKPVKVPLVHQRPEGTARQLPNGRGFLRALPRADGQGSTAAERKPDPTPPAAGGSGASKLQFKSADECLKFFGLKPDDDER
jgi:IS1 family transposase